MNLGSEQLATIARFFSSSVVREMARNGKSPLLARLAKQSGLIGAGTELRYVYNLFQAAFSVLEKEGYRHEYIYKAALTHRVLLGTHSLRTASMLNEFRVGRCKADTVILNGTSTVYEVKSERDSLTRLDRQVAAYAKVFARVCVIASEKHVPAVVDSVPSEVGVLQLNRRRQISTLREATDQAEFTNSADIFDSIRTLEARLILESKGIEIPTVPNTELNALLRHHFVKLPPLEAHDGMVRVLQKTRNLLPLSSLVNQLPRSLHTAALSVRLRKLDHARLVAAVNTRLKDAMAWA